MPYLLLLFLVFSTSIFSLELPYSTTPVHTEMNQVSDFVSLEEPYKEKVPLQTYAWAWYDEDNLYIDWEVEIDSTFKVGTYGAKDSQSIADFVRIQIQTCPNDKFAYLFFAYPTGMLADGIRDQYLNTTYDWNGDYSYTTERSDSLWNVRMLVPFRSLRVMGKPPYEWKIQFTRSVQKHEPNKVYGYPYTSIKKSAVDYYKDYIPVQLKHKVHCSHNYNLSGYLTRQYDLMNKTTTYDPDHVGIDIEYRPTGNVSTKLSFNPDFSEVPLDSEEDVSNIHYSRWLGENRFFFTEDLDAFGIPSNFLYTRSIAQPRYAAKVTGNSQYFTYAIMNALDKKVADDGEGGNEGAYYTVAALRGHNMVGSLQMDILNRYNADNKDNAWSLFTKPQWSIGSNDNLEFYTLYTLKKSAEVDWKKGLEFYLEYSHRVLDQKVGLSVTRNTRDFAPAIGAPGSDQDNGYSTISIWEDFGRDYANGAFKHISHNVSIFKSHEYYHEHNDTYGGSVFGSIRLVSDIVFVANGNMSRNTHWLLEESRDMKYTAYNSSLGISYVKYDEIHGGITLRKMRSFYYSLDTVNNCQVLSFDLSGDIVPYLSYYGQLMHYEWASFPDNVQGGLKPDPNYDIGNIDLTVNFSDKLFLTAGLRYNNNEVDFYDEGQLIYWADGSLGGFATLRYEHSKNCSVYLGYRGSGMDEMGELSNTDKTAWFKVKLTL